MCGVAGPYGQGLGVGICSRVHLVRRWSSGARRDGESMREAAAVEIGSLQE